MKHSIRAITAGDAAYAAEVERLQVMREASQQFGVPARLIRRDGDPLLHVASAPPLAPSEMEMLLAGLREMEKEGE